MRAPRFSIATLLTVIALSGVGLAALRSPSPLWASAIYTVAAVAIVAAASSAILGRGARRAYWLGFSLFGGAYFYLTMGFNSHVVTEAMLDLLYPYAAPQSPQPAPNPPTPFALRPAATAATSVSYGTNVWQQDSAAATVATPAAVAALPAAPPTFVPVSAPTVSAWEHWMQPDRRLGEFAPLDWYTARFSSVSFRQIGHSLAALLAATLGGVFVRWRYQVNSSEEYPSEVAS
jgi:hypothetical protein